MLGILMPRAVTTDNPLALLFTWPGITIGKAKAKIVDENLLNLALLLDSELVGQTIEEKKKYLLLDMEHSITEMSEGESKEMAKVFKRYVEDPDKIKISAIPDSPVSIQKIMQHADEGKAAEILNLNVSL